MFESILVPSDGSEDMARVTEYAVAMADEFDATMYVLHVVDDRAYASIPDDARDRVRETLEADAEDANRFVAEHAIDADVDVVREVRWGNPPATIIAYAEEVDTDLVVMGTHGRTGYDRYLLGSVAEKVVRAAPLPVLTVNIGERQADVDGFSEVGTVRSPER